MAGRKGEQRNNTKTKAKASGEGRTHEDAVWPLANQISKDPPPSLAATLQLQHF